ncbi:uncharacterized protein LOC111907901 [Lactuca sativa]|uniref:uncharacterized protein LOC111907901 n=1 Tax=Lactuca sativa TaxID=4236 RepID=UPI000CD94B78|nr:uncharacterized protein LOC111907901 [Lactuca sativa]
MAKEKGIFHGIKLPRDGLDISHLQYADDMIFIGSCSIENAKNLIKILRCFELSLRLKVNMSKSKIFGFGFQSCDLNLVARSFNCFVGSLPFIYLGLQVGESMIRTTHWNPIGKKFQADLSKWKANPLSFSGRLTLCISVLSSLVSFYLSLFKALVKVIKSIEKIRMRFFRGGDMVSRKMVWIAWEKALAAKDKGGLGIGSLKVQNIALMRKW